ncbi:MAG: HNH endonuclease [Alphaproteobacteria bacterium]|nr:HNH endonuclease [Alphaproteobacteria bacterium]
MIKNRTIFTGDNLPILRGMADESVDLIYLDPPFNSNRNYEAPIGSAAAGASFKDAWTFEDRDDAWWGQIAEDRPELHTVIDTVGKVGGKGAQAYSIYMTVRLLEMHRVLKDTGSIYLHCDQTMSHSLKLAMDAIFGRTNFRNEIIWHYGKMSNTSRNYPQNHDTILFYSKTDGYTFTPIKGGESEYRNRYEKHLVGNQVLYGSVKHSQDKLILGRVKKVKQGLGRDLRDDDVLFDFDEEFKTQSNVMYIPIIKGNSKERTGYPTQKPLELLRRIVKASSNKGDMILDPFCGCATACVAAEDEKREWAGIDISELAFNIVRERLHKSREDGGIGSLFANEVINRKDIPRDRGVVRSKDIKHTLYGQQEGICKGCLVHFSFRNLEEDHIVPVSKGGSEDDSNKQLLCGACNRKKGPNDMPCLIAQLRREGLR